MRGDWGLQDLPPLDRGFGPRDCQPSVTRRNDTNVVQREPTLTTAAPHTYTTHSVHTLPCFPMDICMVSLGKRAPRVNLAPPHAHSVHGHLHGKSMLFSHRVTVPKRADTHVL